MDCFTESKFWNQIYTLKSFVLQRAILPQIINFLAFIFWTFIVKEVKNRTHLWMSVKKAALEYYFLT